MGSKRLVIVVAVLTGLLGVSSIAVADDVEPRDEDTIVSFGYDEFNRILAVNSGDNDTPWICNFAAGALAATYINIIDGFFEIDTLTSAGEPASFAARPQHQVSDGGAAGPGETTPYTGALGECGVHGAVVGGPNGQINHGQFMKAAKSLIDIKGYGCIVREFAKSDIGRTEATRLRTSDVDSSFSPAANGDITFETFEADCSKPNTREGKPEKGRPDSPGNSADAPGQNKGD